MNATEILSASSNTSKEDVPADVLICSSIDNLDKDLSNINQKIHENPELCYAEFKAHENITALLQSHDIQVEPHAYGIETSFSAEYGSGGRVITFCAEYDALPEIGHACGHNLIATTAIAAFLGVVEAVKEQKIPGRVRLLGCPAEEGGGGKIKLVDAAAFADVDAALMIHPMPQLPMGNYSPDLAGIAYGTCLAAYRFKVVFTGKAAHAGAMPWLGINALDAATLSYNAVSMLRQQASPTNRINIIIKEGGTSSNVIPEQSVIEACVRSVTLKEMTALTKRLYKCFEGAAIATGCTVEFVKEMDPYADLRPNATLCTEFTSIMKQFEREFLCDLKNIHEGGYGTDMGNVSYECPSFHGLFAVPSELGENIHSAEFTRTAGTKEAYAVAIQVAKGMALTGWKILTDEKVATQSREDFRKDKLKQ